MSAGLMRISPRSARAAIGETSASRAVEWFLVVEFLCQVALMFPSIGSSRLFVRCAAFGTSLALTMFLLPGKWIHPAIKPLVVALALVAIGVFHPTTNTALAGVMQFALYVAIAAPLLWVSNLKIDSAEVRRILLIVLVFHTVSSFVGILQVYYPGSFRGALSSVVAASGKSYLYGLYYRNAYGQLVLRPSGLTDVPGGVSAAGQYATLLSLYFFLTDRSTIARMSCLGAALVGVTAVYLSGVKAAMISLTLCLGVFVILFFWRTLTTRRMLAVSQRERRRISAIQVLAIVATIAIGGYFVAVSVGGEGVLGAAQALRSGSPSEVFYRERGRFLEYTLSTLLPQYPLGAGLGRWGMMSYYFGNPSNYDSPGIWVEIQWTGWLLDGGVPLVLAYSFALLVALRFAVKCALTDSLNDLAVLGALISAYDVGVLAITFSSVPFIGSGGLDFWLLNAVLYAAVVCAYQMSGRVRMANETVSAGRR